MTTGTIIMPVSDTQGNTTDATVTITVDDGGANQTVSGDQPDGFTVPEGETWEVAGLVTTPSNVVVKGTLQMRPGATLRFRDVDESAFVGGDTTVPIDSDVGLWMLDQGKLDAQGTPKTPWTRLVSGISAGVTTFDVLDATGWQVGDEIVITATVPRSVPSFWTKDDRRTIAEINGNTVTVDSGLTNAHPAVSFSGASYTAEVLNLTRDVVIEGTPGGRAHVIYLHQGMEALSQIGPNYVELRHLGPGGSSGGVLGRYAIHFHHGSSTTEGIVAEGMVAHDCGNHAFVAHESNGVTWRQCVAHDITETPFWWDAGDTSNRVVYDRCVASRVRAFNGPGKFKGAGFFLNRTTEELTSKCIDCVATGIDGQSDPTGFFWDNGSVGVWTFQNCLAHNIRHQGIRVWQNNSTKHPVDFFDAYACGIGISHGAYSNRYHYHDVRIHDCGTGVHARAVSRFTADAWEGQEWHRIVVTDCPTPLRLSDAAVDSEIPTDFRDCQFASAVVDCEDIHSGQVKHWDLTDCGINPDNVTQQNLNPVLRLRTQQTGGEAWQLTESGEWVQIDPF